jgi:BMFP domain-containing protein YqiC
MPVFIMVIILDVIDARVKKCKDITILVDKKMRERKFETEKFIIQLDDTIPFQADDFVKIVSKEDFEKLGSILKSLRKDRNQLQDNVKRLETLLEVQAQYIGKLESKDKSNDVAFKFKDLLKI